MGRYQRLLLFPFLGKSSEYKFLFIISFGVPVTLASVLTGTIISLIMLIEIGK